MRKLRHREVTQLGSGKTLSPGRLAPETVFLTTTQYCFTSLRKNLKGAQVQVKGMRLAFTVGETMRPVRMKGGWARDSKDRGRGFPEKGFWKTSHSPHIRERRNKAQVAHVASPSPRLQLAMSRKQGSSLMPPVQRPGSQGYRGTGHGLSCAGGPQFPREKP